MRPVQLSLFGAQSVHLGHRSPVTGTLACAVCGVSLAISAAQCWCERCPGRAVPAPPWAVLGEYAGGLETLQEAA
jgi:hypothetical protein